MAIAANYEFEITQGKPSKLAQEYLAEIRAEAARTGFIAGLSKRSLGVCLDWELAADQYAAKVRQGGAE